MKFSKKIVYDYIMGNEIKEYKLEDLENNVKFMIDVIFTSHDKNIYNLCSNNVKKNLDFNKMLIETFNYDKEFVIKITKNFIYNKSICKENKLELIILLLNYINDMDNKFVNNLKIMLWKEYNMDLSLINMVRNNNENDPFFINKLGLGFVIISDKYENYDVILKYYVNNFIYDLLNKEDVNLEKYMHDRFNNVIELNNYGINRVLIDFIMKYDEFLGEYIITHIDLLSDLKKIIKIYIQRWDIHTKEELEIKWDVLLERLKAYINSNENNSIYQFEKIYYNEISYDLYLKFINKSIEWKDIYNLFYKNIDNNSFIERKHLINIKNIILNTLKYNSIDDNYVNDYDNSKVLRFSKD